jgi:hypothetical protein
VEAMLSAVGAGRGVCRRSDAHLDARARQHAPPVSGPVGVCVAEASPTAPGASRRRRG